MYVLSRTITGPYFVQNTLGTYLSALGYTTGLFGKYVNGNHPGPACTCPYASGCAGGSTPEWDYPPGWNCWYGLCDPDAAYFNNSFNDQGTPVKFTDAPADYMTAVIGNQSLAWLNKVANGDKPFFAYIAPHAPHIANNVYPFITTPAPWYAGAMGTAHPQLERTESPRARDDCSAAVAG